MKLLAIADLFIPADIMQKGLASLASRGIEVDVRQWEVRNLEELQNINIAVEQKGPEAYNAPLELFSGHADTEILVVQFMPVSKAALEKLPKLKLLCVLRGGIENIDIDAAKERGITVLNTPGRNARAVAECTVGLMLAEMRNIARSHAGMKQGLWPKDFPNSGRVPELHGQLVGFVGFGHVGHLVFGYLQAFGCNCLIYDPYATEIPAGARQVPLEELLRESDIITIHARLDKDTQHLIGAKEIALMKPTAILVNTARSGLLDQDALVKALQEKRIMGAALDVFDREPIPADDPIMQLDSITMTSHLTGTTIGAFHGSPVLCSGHIQNWLDGKTDKLPRKA